MENWKNIVLNYPGILVAGGKFEDLADSILVHLREKGTMRHAWAIAKFADSVGSFELAAILRRNWLGWILEKDEEGKFKREDSTIKEAVEILTA